MCIDYVECPICGKKLMSLTSHIKAHGIEIKDLDLILEVKPEHEIDLEVNQLKFSSVVSCGRNIMYITQDDIVNIDTFKDKIYGVHRLSKTEM